MIIDTHAHLYANAFDEDREKMVQRAKDTKVSRIYLPNIDSTSVASMHQMEKEYPGYCFAMMGLHPCSVKENYINELEMCRSFLEKRPYVAIGEIGIDLYWDKTFQKEQELAFRTQIEWAVEYNIPFVIHSRDSLDITIDIVSEMQKGQLSGIFHCFTGTLAQANRIIDIGFFMGIGGVVTFKNAGVAEVVKDIPLANLVLETDAPYLSPVPFRGKRNESAYLDFIIDKIAITKNLSREEVAVGTTLNALAIYEKH